MVARRPLGNTGLSVTVVGFGGARIGSLNNPAPASQVRSAIAAALSGGITLFDTANVYGQGDSERILGRLLPPELNQVVLSTKVGKSFSHKVRLMRWAKPAMRLLARNIPALREEFRNQRAKEVVVRFNADRVSRQLRESLRRLRRSNIHILLLHDADVTAIRDQEIVRTLKSAQIEGRIATFGISGNTKAQIDAALDLDGIGVVQLPVSLAADLAKTGHLQALRDRGIGVIVRELLQPHDGSPPMAATLQQAIEDALRLPGVASALVGMSSQEHVQALIKIAT